MQVKMDVIAFGRWKGELWDGDELLVTVLGPRPGCVMRDLFNKFCLEYEEIPKTEIRMEVTSWQ